MPVKKIDQIQVVTMIMSIALKELATPCATAYTATARINHLALVNVKRIYRLLDNFTSTLGFILRVFINLKLSMPCGLK